jgi:hypothetical protein
MHFAFPSHSGGDVDNAWVVVYSLFMIFWSAVRVHVPDPELPIHGYHVIRYHTEMYQSTARGKIWEQYRFSFQYKLYQRALPDFSACGTPNMAIAAKPCSFMHGARVSSTALRKKQLVSVTPGLMAALALSSPQLFIKFWERQSAELSLNWGITVDEAPEDTIRKVVFCCFGLSLKIICPLTVFPPLSMLVFLAWRLGLFFPQPDVGVRCRKVQQMPKGADL